MEWLIGALILSIFLSTLLRKYYYPSILFKTLKRNEKKQGKLLSTMLRLQLFLLVGIFLNYIQEIKSNFKAYHSLDALSEMCVSIAILVALIAIWQWRKWGVYLLFIIFGFLFIKGNIEFFLFSQYLTGLPIFIMLSVINDGLLIWALKRKWSQFF
jgi:hypothetical protein